MNHNRFTNVVPGNPLAYDPLMPSADADDVHPAPILSYDSSNPPPPSVATLFARANEAMRDLQELRSSLDPRPVLRGVPYTPGLKCPSCGGRALRQSYHSRRGPDLYAYAITEVVCHGKLCGERACQGCEPIIESKELSDRNLF